MQYTLSTVSAFVAALSLTSAAPMPATQGSSQQVTIVRQLAGFDSASTIQAKLDATTVNDRDVKSAAVSQAGPWCAGFTDAQATQPVTALNGDGIFDSQNPAIYTNDQDSAVPVGSWWCAATRPEVEAFVARATGGNQGGEQGEAPTPAPTEPAPVPISNGGNNNDDDDDDAATTTTVRVQIELEADTTFVQAELPANVGLVAASTVRQLANGVVSISVVGSERGDCDFLDAQGNVINFEQTQGLVQVGAFVCEA